MNKQMFSMRQLVPSANTIHKTTTKSKHTTHKLLPYKKQKIPKALAEQVWIRYMGHTFEGKCRVSWCQNTITVFDFQSGHNIPESRGGATTLENLIPICSRCNLGMGNKKTIDEWSAEFGGPASKPSIPTPSAPTPQQIRPLPQPPQQPQRQLQHQPQPNHQQPPKQNAIWRCLVSCFTYEERTHR
jgi:hypothetical protein